MWPIFSERGWNLGIKFEKFEILSGDIFSEINFIGGGTYFWPNLIKTKFGIAILKLSRGEICEANANGWSLGSFFVQNSG